ncbi:hypothetical protein Tco_0109153 [Tanacetum coccineum]
MTILAEFMIIAGADNRPPMLEKSIYDSWKSRMELYIVNRENGRMILNLVLNGPLVWPTIVEENGTTRTKKYEELSVAEKLQAECDLKATNNLLQGLLPDVYDIVNHHKFSKEIWDRVKLLMQGMKLSLQEKECKLYDEFDKCSFVKGETLLPPKWSKFIMDVKFPRDLHTTNYDQLYSYLEQHEAHANETRLMHERYQDPLAYVANFNQPSSHITNYHSPYNTTQFPQQTNTMIPQVHSPQSYLPMNAAPHLSQPQISHSSVPPLHQYQSYMEHQTLSVPQNAYHSPQVSTQPMNEFPQLDSDLAVLMPIFKTTGLCNKFKGGKDKVMLLLAIRVMLLVLRETMQEGMQGLLNAIIVKVKDQHVRHALSKRLRNVAWFKDKEMLAEAQESG